MKSVIKSIALVSTLVAGMAASGYASATPIVLPKAVTGSVTLKQSITITCNFTGTLQSNGSGGLEIANPKFVAGNALCGGLVKTNAGPWSVTFAAPNGPNDASHSGALVTIGGVGASTFVGGNCAGSITGNVSDSGSGHTLTLTAPQTIPGTPSNCQILGGTFNF